MAQERSRCELASMFPAATCSLESVLSQVLAQLVVMELADGADLDVAIARERHGEA